jgi:eukaryotic-like serine/threonine-protein kinase
VADDRCKHCGAKHEPWALVCPVTRLPLVTASRIPPSPGIPRTTAGTLPRKPSATPSQGMRMVIPASPPVPSAPASKRLTGRVIGDRYGVTGVIAEGAMGVVYEAEHLTMGKRVAVKVLHPRHAQDREAGSRLRHEARVAGTLGHPNICAIYDMGQLEDGSPYLVLERLHGETLAQRLSREHRVPTVDMIDILMQVLSALAAAHQRSVVHRDLKPENIFLSKREGMRPVPKLLDFGISRADDVEDSVSDTSGAQLAAGTPFYMAPEQARGDRNFDWRVDLWAAGVVLYEGLTGARPFVAKNFNALLVDIQTGQHQSILDHDASLSSGLAQVVDRALAKNPDDRYPSALELQNALRSYKDLEAGAPRRMVPILLNEHTTDDGGDSTHVFSRFDVARAVEGPPEEPPEDDRTTLTDEPSFENDLTPEWRKPSTPRRKG